MLLLKYPHYVYKVRDTHKLKKVSKYIKNSIFSFVKVNFPISKTVD